MNSPDTNSPVTSPTLPTDEGIVKTPKAFSDGLTLDLTDEEITRALQIMLPIKQRWQDKFRSKIRHQNFSVEDAMKLIDQFEDELKYELATKCHLLTRVDAEPVFEGKPPIIEFIGALGDHGSATHGLDHEKKERGVKKSVEQGTAFLGSDTLQ